MSKQDRTYTRTAADLERKYNLGQLAQGVPEKNPDSEQVSKVAQELSEYKTAVNRKLQSIETSINEIEGVIGSGGKSGWYYLTEKSGQTGTITLPTGFKELHVVIGIANYMYTFNILADYLSSTDMMFRNGYCLSTSAYGDMYISVNKTAISGWTVRKENVLQNATVKVYYK